MSARCKLCDPRATPADTGYCDRCSPGTTNRVVTVARTVTAEREAAVQPEECGGCGRLTYLAEGRCLICRLSGVPDTPALAPPRAPERGPVHMTAVWWSVCRGCEQRIEVGETMTLADLSATGHRHWVHERCGS